MGFLKGGSSGEGLTAAGDSMGSGFGSRFMDLVKQRHPLVGLATRPDMPEASTLPVDPTGAVAMNAQPKSGGGLAMLLKLLGA